MTPTERGAARRRTAEPEEGTTGGGEEPADGPVTRALVLAAGEGSRLNHDTPKPAYPLLGVPLLARTLFTLEEAGVARAHVVVGHEAARVRRSVEAIERLDLEIEWIHNDRWEGRNGLSVLAAEWALAEEDEPFLLTMADHVVEPAVVDALVRRSDDPAAVELAVDTRPGEVSDLEDATKVRTEAGRIEAIGKSLTSFDSVDTGVFLATPTLFEALRAVDRPQGPSLSDGVQRLADRGRARVVDVGERMWHDVDTPRDVEIAERKLLEQVRSEEDGPVARHLNRPLSTALSRWLVKHTSVTANQVSVGTLGVGLLSAALAAVGGYAAHLAAGLLFQAASVLDGSDGEVAKLTFRAGKRGEWVDTLCDNLAYLAFLVGLTAGAFRMGLPDLYTHTGLLAIGAATVSMASINLHLLLRDESGSARDVEYGYQEGDDAGSRLMQVLHYLGKRDMLAMVVLALAVVGRLPLGLPVFGIAATVLMVPATGKALLSALRGDEEPATRTAERARGPVGEAEPGTVGPEGRAVASRPGAPEVAGKRLAGSPEE